MRYTIKQARAVSQIKKYASVARIVRYQRAFNKYAAAYKMAGGEDGAWQKIKDFAVRDYENAKEHPVLAGIAGAGAGGATGYIVDLLNAIRKARKGEAHSLAPGVGTLVGAGLGTTAGISPYLVADIKKSFPKKETK